MYRTTVYIGKLQLRTTSDWLLNPRGFEWAFDRPSPMRGCLDEGFTRWPSMDINVQWMPDCVNDRIVHMHNLSHNADTLCDKETSDWLAKVRNLPHNLDAHGTSTIPPFQTFRVGQRLFWWDAWRVAYYEHNPEVA